MNHWSYRYKLNPRKPLNPLCCSCPNCKYVLKSTAHWLTPQTKKSMTVKLGDRVLVQGLFTGTVKYVGDLDRDYVDDQTFIGVKLDEPVGKSDGVYEGKRFFQCPNNHGVIVPIHHIHLLVPREGLRLRDERKHPRSYTIQDASKVHYDFHKSFNADNKKQDRKNKKFDGESVSTDKKIPSSPNTTDYEPESSDQEGYDPSAQKTSRKINLPKHTYDGTKSASARFTERTDVSVPNTGISIPISYPDSSLSATNASTKHPPPTSDAATHAPMPATRTQASMTKNSPVIATHDKGTSPTKKQAPSTTTQTAQYRSSSVATGSSSAINKLASITTQTGKYRSSSVASETVNQQASTTTQTSKYRTSSVAVGNFSPSNQQATQTAQSKHSSVAAGSSSPIHQYASTTTQTAPYRNSSVATSVSPDTRNQASMTFQNKSSVASGISPVTRNQAAMTFQNKCSVASGISSVTINKAPTAALHVQCKNKAVAAIQCKSSPAIAGEYKSSPGTNNADAWPCAAESTCSLAPKMQSKSATEFESTWTADSNVAMSGGITQDPSSFSRTQNISTTFLRPKNFSSIFGMSPSRTESYPNYLNITSDDCSAINYNSSSHFSTAAPPSCFISSAGESRMATAGGLSTHATDVSSIPNSFVKQQDLKSQTKSIGPLNLANIYKYCGSSSSSSDLRYEDFEEVNKAVQKQIPPSQMLEGEESDSKLLLSGLAVKDSGFPPPPFNTAMDKITRMRDMVDKWGGGERGFHMALTLQKLHAARLKGMKEVEWQKELQLMDKDAEFSARKKVLDSLKAEILETRRKSAIVNEQTRKTQMLLNETESIDEIDELKAKIQKLQRKNATTLRELNRHPIACGDIVRKTISRITEEYKERKRNISETCGPHSVLQCN